MITRSRAAVAVLLGAVFLGVGGLPGVSTVPAAASGWRLHVDRVAGFSIEYPDAWSVFQSRDPAVQFLAGPDESDFVVVRVIANLPVSFPANNPQVTRKFVDGLLANQAITILSATEVTYSGLPGWQYVYTFNDPTAGTGVHIHVFLFDGNRLETIVFQVLPSSKLKGLAPAFDQILTRYRSLAVPGGTSPGAQPSGSTSPRATATP